MLFSEALQLLQQGETMCRDAWCLEDGYLKFMPGMKFVWKIVLLPNPNAGNYIFSVEDFLSDDWKKFDMPMATIEAQIAEAA
jgi:hypothetical protein